MNETHPYNLREKIPSDTHLLVVGTAPPPRFSHNSTCGGMRGLDFDFFYGSEDNYMWQFLEEIAEEVDEKKLFVVDSPDDCTRAARHFLQRHKVWMHDVLQVYRRKSGRKCSASDVDIEFKEFADFRSIIEPSTHLNAIAFTSEQAAKWTFEALRDQNLISQTSHDMFEEKLSQWKSIKITATDRERDIKRKFELPFLKLDVDRRAIDFYLLPSPTGRSRVGLRIGDKKNIYKNVMIRN